MGSVIRRRRWGPLGKVQDGQAGGIAGGRAWTNRNLRDFIFWLD